MIKQQNVDEQLQTAERILKSICNSADRTGTDGWAKIPIMGLMEIELYFRTTGQG